jgi:hypothetical protein
VTLLIVDKAPKTSKKQKQAYEIEAKEMYEVEVKQNQYAKKRNKSET